MGKVLGQTENVKVTSTIDSAIQKLKVCSVPSAPHPDPATEILRLGILVRQIPYDSSTSQDIPSEISMYNTKSNVS